MLSRADVVQGGYNKRPRATHACAIEVIDERLQIGDSYARACQSFTLDTIEAWEFPSSLAVGHLNRVYSALSLGCATSTEIQSVNQSFNQFIFRGVHSMISMTQDGSWVRGKTKTQTGGILIRPPNIVCRRTYILPRILSFFLLSFFRQLLSELAERNPTKTGHIIGSKCNLKMHVRNLGYPFPLQIEGPKPPFIEDFAT